MLYGDTCLSVYILVNFWENYRFQGRHCLATGLTVEAVPKFLPTVPAPYTMSHFAKFGLFLLCSIAQYSAECTSFMQYLDAATIQEHPLLARVPHMHQRMANLLFFGMLLIFNCFFTSWDPPNLMSHFTVCREDFKLNWKNFQRDIAG